MIDYSLFANNKIWWKSSLLLKNRKIVNILKANTVIDS